jgi:fused signal recognition particle receptor
MTSDPPDPPAGKPARLLGRLFARSTKPAGEEAPPPAKPGWFERLRGGLSRSSTSLGQGITAIFTKRALDAEMLDELEDVLIRADLGPAAASRITASLAKGKYDKGIEPDEVKAILAREIETILTPVARPLVIDRTMRPFVILVVGVNGAGKTTTIGKLSEKFRREGLSVVLAAGDTFRAAAIEQLRIWGERSGASVVAREQGADPASLAFDALGTARREEIGRAHV